jgi:hypothetical protein
MKVLDLQCSQQHSFEGWFGSEDDFQSQLTRGLVQCPLCGNADIIKKLSAPRFNLGKTAAPTAQKTTEAKSETAAGTSLASTVLVTQDQTTQPLQSTQRPPMSPEVAAVMQAAWMDMAKHVMANTEDVGNSFASEARKIHYGEADERAIRGHATQDQTMELIEEGIDVMPLPIPESLKRPLN